MEEDELKKDILGMGFNNSYPPYLQGIDAYTRWGQSITTTNITTGDGSYTWQIPHPGYNRIPTTEELMRQEISTLTYQNRELRTMLNKLAEHLLIEKAKRDGFDVVNIMKQLRSDSPGDREIAIALVNDNILTEILNNK